MTEFTCSPGAVTVFHQLDLLVATHKYTLFISA